MIFHTPTSTTLKGEKAHASVKRLQLALEKVARLTGDDKYNPANYGGKLDGVVDATTVWALAQAVRDGLAEAPGAAGDILGWLGDTVFWVIDKVPLLSGFGAFQKAYRYGIPEVIDPLEDKIDPKIIQFANAIDNALQATIGKLQSGGGGGIGPGPIGPMVMQRGVKVAIPQTYPEGAFAVRDPKLNQYRILVPIR